MLGLLGFTCAPQATHGNPSRKHNFRRVFEKPINQDLEEQRRHGTAVALASFHRLPRPKCMRRWNAPTEKAILSHITPQRPPTTACSRVLHKIVCTKTDDFFLHARLSFDSPGKSPMTSMTSMTSMTKSKACFQHSQPATMHRCNAARHLVCPLYVVVPCR